MADINNDGWLDIYVCNAGSMDDPALRKNQLFINNHGATRGLNPEGYLIVRKDDGTDTLILAGGVRAAGA